MAILSKKDVLTSLLMGSVLLASGSSSWAQDAAKPSNYSLNPQVQQTLDIFKSILGTPQQTATPSTTEETTATTEEAEAAVEDAVEEVAEESVTEEAVEEIAETKTKEQLAAENLELKKQLEVLRDIRTQEYERRIETYEMKKSELERHIKMMEDEKTAVEAQIETLKDEMDDKDDLDS